MSIYKNNKSGEHHVSKDGKETLCGREITSGNYTKTAYETLADADKADKEGTICNNPACEKG